MRIGADVGGTFTDVVLEHADGSFTSTKVLTTYEAPEVGILDGISQIMNEASAPMSDLVQIIHGTTLATNALIERRGARTALVTTEGFRDVIETRTESRFEQYDLNIVLPKPLIARKDRFVVSERLNAAGETLVPFDEAGAEAVIGQLAAGDYRSVPLDSFIVTETRLTKNASEKCSRRLCRKCLCQSAVKCLHRCASTNGSTLWLPTLTCSR